MTTTTATTTDTTNRPRAEAPHVAVASTFLEALAAQDFHRLGAALCDGAQLRALLPGGLRTSDGAESIVERFSNWFGDTTQFDLVGADLGEVGGRLHLRWCVRLRADRLGPGWSVVEQQAYVDCDDHGHIASLDLLCSGYRPEGSDA